MRIYLDHNAGAPLRPEAREAMLRFLGRPGNPSSAHREGARARGAVEAARAEVAALIGAGPAEIVFTSGATEANNLALRGVVRAPAGLVTTAIEHASVLETARALASVGLANGEVGSVAPVAAIAGGLRVTGVRLHTDAAQAAGRMPIDVRALGVDLLSLSAH